MQSTLSSDSFFNKNYDKQFEHDINHPVNTQTTISYQKQKENIIMTIGKFFI